jgi:biotin synthase-related radical SAM superfamily protein
MKSTLRESFATTNPYLFDDKSVHSARLCLAETIYVNANFGDSYTKNSPYSIEQDNKNLLLIKNGIPCCPVDIDLPPSWYGKKTNNGTIMSDVLRLHGNSVLALSNHYYCRYHTSGSKCLFCAFMYNNPQKANLTKRIPDIIDTLKCALKGADGYALALSEGTMNGDDCGATYFARIADAVKSSYSDIEISAELVPPKEDIYITKLIDSGVTSIIMNIEFFDNQTRVKMCPGKSAIPLERYYQALSFSVERLGTGRVGSVLIAGIEPVEKTIEGAIALLNIGVLPTIIPFRPYDNCALSAQKPTDPQILVTIERAILGKIDSLGLRTQRLQSCMACDACNACSYSNIGERFYV